jgi:hypothetical protein
VDDESFCLVSARGKSCLITNLNINCFGVCAVLFFLLNPEKIVDFASYFSVNI